MGKLSQSEAKTFAREIIKPIIQQREKDMAATAKMVHPFTKRTEEIKKQFKKLEPLYKEWVKAKKDVGLHIYGDQSWNFASDAWWNTQSQELNKAYAKKNSNTFSDEQISAIRDSVHHMLLFDVAKGLDIEKAIANAEKYVAQQKPWAEKKQA